MIILKEGIEMNPVVMEPLFFANIVTREFNKNSPSQIIPVMKVAADYFDLELKAERQFKIAKKYLIKCINCN